MTARSRAARDLLASGVVEAPRSIPRGVRPGVWLFAAACLLAALGIAAGLARSATRTRRRAAAAARSARVVGAARSQPSRRAKPPRARSDAGAAARVRRSCRRPCRSRCTRSALDPRRGGAARGRDGARRRAAATRTSPPRSACSKSEAARVAESLDLARREARSPRPRDRAAEDARVQQPRRRAARRALRAGRLSRHRVPDRAIPPRSARGPPPRARCAASRPRCAATCSTSCCRATRSPSASRPIRAARVGLRVGERVALTAVASACRSRASTDRAPRWEGSARWHVLATPPDDRVAVSVVKRTADETSHSGHRTRHRRRYVSRRQNREWEKCMEGQAHQSAVVFALSHMTIEGMVTMTILGLMSFASWTVIVGKALRLRKQRRLAAEFYRAFSTSDDPFELAGQEAEGETSTLQGRAALHGLQLRLPGDAGPARRASRRRAAPTERGARRTRCSPPCAPRWSARWATSRCASTPAW